MQSKYIPAYLLTFVNVLGFSILLPVLPFVVTRYGGSEAMYGLLISAYSAFQFIGAPWLGRMSDSTGRKSVLLITQTGTLLSWVIFGAAWFIPNISVGVIALPLLVIAAARMLDGITGGNVSVTQAYVSDISTRAEKSYIFAYVGGIAGVGMIVGPGIGGYMGSTQWGFLAVAVTGAVISAVTLVSIQLFLKESLPPEERKPPVKQPLSHSVRLLKRIQLLDPPKIIKRIFVVRGLFSAMMAAYISTIALYIIDLFKFDERTLGIFMLVVGVFMIFNQAVISRWFIRRLGEVPTMRIGLGLSAAGLFCITLTENLYVYILFYYVLNLGISLAIPTFNTLMAQHADPKDMGEVMGISSSFISLSNAIIPVFAASLYGLIGERFFHLAAILPLASLFMSRSIIACESEPTPQQSLPCDHEVH